MKRESGLSFVELLVVVVIIFLVIAILLPSVSHGPMAAKKVTCGTNLKAILGATAIYAAQFNDFLPVPSQNGATWSCDMPKASRDELQRTINASSKSMTAADVIKLFYCPGNSMQDPTKLWNNPGTPVIGYAWMGERGGLLDVRIPRPPGPPLEFHEKFNSTKNPSQEELAFDWIITSDVATRDFASVRRGSDGYPTSHMNGANPSGGNVACFDGHIEWRSWTNTEKAAARPFDGAAFWVVNP